jgi:hypothetical protein
MDTKLSALQLTARWEDEARVSRSGIIYTSALRAPMHACWALCLSLFLERGLPKENYI